ncbi:MAG: hypothetical protein ABIM21_03540 [candidate division WOR-3 bacterium]
MKLNPNKYYWCILKVGNEEKKSRCIQLGYRPLTEDELKSVGNSLSVNPTHVVSFFDFESRRQIFARLIAEDEHSVTFQVGPDKYYIFREFTL